MISDEAAKALGKLVRNLKNPRWLAAQAAETAISITVLNWAGQKVSAWFKGSVHHDDGHVAKHYHCDDGHDYVGCRQWKNVPI